MAFALTIFASCNGVQKDDNDLIFKAQSVKRGKMPIQNGTYPISEFNFIIENEGDSLGTVALFIPEHSVDSVGIFITQGVSEVEIWGFKRLIIADGKLSQVAKNIHPSKIVVEVKGNWQGDLKSCILLLQDSTTLLLKVEFKDKENAASLLLPKS